jgi:Asp-tRNA(Asn)/Glu-tRNA(Gln) amidotransferase A subunit family amidase
MLKPIQSRQSRHESPKRDAAREAGGCPPCALAYTALFKLTGYLVATFPMRFRDDLLPAGLQIRPRGDQGRENEHRRFLSWATLPSSRKEIAI